MPGWEGIWPVAPTPFLENGEVDYDGMRRVLDCMVDQGSTGICILANFSEQFLLSDDEREALSRLSLETGAQDSFASARSLYARAGFSECPPFGSYRPDPNSVFMTREL